MHTNKPQSHFPAGARLVPADGGRMFYELAKHDKAADR